MDALVHTRDYKTFETVDFTRRACSKEIQDCPLRRKANCHHFLGFTKYDLYRLPGMGQNSHEAVPCRFIWADLTHNGRKSVPFGKEKVLFHHDNPLAHTSALARDKFVELRYKLLPHTPLSPNLAPCEICCFHALVVTCTPDVWVEWGGHRCNGGLPCRPEENVLFRRVKEVRTSLGQVYRTERRLYWKMNRHFFKIFVFLL